MSLATESRTDRGTAQSGITYKLRILDLGTPPCERLRGWGSEDLGPALGLEACAFSFACPLPERLADFSPSPAASAAAAPPRAAPRPVAGSAGHRSPGGTSSKPRWGKGPFCAAWPGRAINAQGGSGKHTNYEANRDPFTRRRDATATPWLPQVRGRPESCATRKRSVARRSSA